MKAILDLNDLMVEQLRELYDAELLLMSFADDLSGKAANTELQMLLQEYAGHTHDNHWVLKQVFNNLFTQKRGEKAHSLRQLQTDTRELIDRCHTDQVRDATVILGLQHIIHYKIATYGAVCTYANILGLYDDAAKLHDVLEREKNMDRKLAVLADTEVDREAYNYLSGI